MIFKNRMPNIHFRTQSINLIFYLSLKKSFNLAQTHQPCSAISNIPKLYVFNIQFVMSAFPLSYFISLVIYLLLSKFFLNFRKQTRCHLYTVRPLHFRVSRMHNNRLIFLCRHVLSFLSQFAGVYREFVKANP